MCVKRYSSHTRISKDSSICCRWIFCYNYMRQSASDLGLNDSQVFYSKAVTKKFTKFIVKYLHWSFFFNKVYIQLFIKKNFLWILRDFSEQLFLKTPPDDWLLPFLSLKDPFISESCIEIKRPLRPS